MDKKWGGASFTNPENLAKRKKYQKPENFQKPKKFQKPKSASKAQRFSKSDNVINLVHFKDIIDNIKLVNDRYKNSNDRTRSLLEHINNAQISIDEVYYGKKGRSWGSLDKDALLDLIKDVHNASSKTVSSISGLIENNNENSRLLAAMISALTRLLCLSSVQISETTAELAEIASHLQKNTSGTNVQGMHINKIIVSQIEKFKEEKERTEKYENNFNVIFQKLKESEEHFQLERQELTEKVNEIETETLNTIRTQKSKINLLTVISITNFFIIVAFIIYYFSR